MNLMPQGSEFQGILNPPKKTDLDSDAICMHRKHLCIESFRNLHANGSAGDSEELLKLRAEIIAYFLSMQEYVRDFHPRILSRTRALSYSYDQNLLTQAFEILSGKLYEKVEKPKEMLL